MQEVPRIFPKSKWGRSIAKMSISWIFKVEMLENYRFENVETSEFRLSMIYSKFLSCFEVVPKGGDENRFLSDFLCQRIRPSEIDSYFIVTTINLYMMQLY